MTESCDVKKRIAKMYFMMSRACRRQSEAIENDIDGYVINDLKMGYEMVIDNGKTYQLICELKELFE